jgi:histidine triad (HIT) family protein
MEETIFHKIIKGDAPATVVYEDEFCKVIENIQPKAPVHVLVLPKKEIVRLGEMQAGDMELMGRLMWVVKTVAEQLGISKNFKVVINSGPGVSHVPYLHIHVIGGWGTIKPEDYEV